MALGQALGEWLDVVQGDLDRIFGRFRIWSFFSIPFMLSFMMIKWILLAFLVPLRAIVYAAR